MNTFKHRRYIVLHDRTMALNRETQDDDCMHMNNSISEDFIRDFMDLDEFLATTTAVLESCDDGNNYSPSIVACDNTTSTNCVVENDITNLSTDNDNINEQHIQEIRDECAFNCNDITTTTTTTTTTYTKHVEEEERQHDRSSQINSSRNNRKNTLNKTSTKDKKYWDRRLKNNIAAKRSRDAKRLKETSLMATWKSMELENTRLQNEITDVTEQVEAIERELDIPSSEKKPDVNL